MTDEKCETCGRPARVRVLEEYQDGAPVFKQYCLECADQRSDRTVANSDPTSDKPRLSFASLMILAGLLIATVAVLGDYIGIRGSGAMGWYQVAGLVIGALFVVLGAMLRADVIALFGTIVFGLAVCVDLFGLSAMPGIGWKQGLAIVVGVALMVVGVVLRFRRA